MSTVLTTLMQRALFELDVGFVIPNADISAIAASQFTAARFFQNTNMSPDFLQLKNTGFIRAGAATAADMYRPAGTLANSTGICQQVGPTWADTTVGSEEIEAWYYGVRRDQEVLRALNRITEFEFSTTMLALSHIGVFDGDMALSTTSQHTQIGTSTLSKISTAGLAIWGPRALRTLNSAVTSGARSGSIRIGTSRQVSAYVIAGTEVGTSSLQGYDNTNSAAFGTAATSSERRPQLLAFQNQSVPSTCKLTSINLTNSSASGDTAWNQEWLYNHDDLTVKLPSLVFESFQAPKIIQAIPRQGMGTNAWDAGSFDFRTLQEGIDYWLMINHADAEPYKVRFNSVDAYNWPLFVEARIPMSALTTFSAESDSTTGPLHKLLPRFKLALLTSVYNLGMRRHPDWNYQYNLCKEELATASVNRVNPSIAAAKPYYMPRASVY